MALPCRNINHRKYCSINKRVDINHLTIQRIGKLISIDCKRTCYHHILGRHRCRYLAPTAKGVSLLHGSSYWLYIRTIRIKRILIDLTIHHIGNLVGVDHKSTRYGYILGRHGLGQLTPSTESVSLLLRNFNNRKYCTIYNRVTINYLTIQRIGNLIGINRERTCHYYILSRHGLRYFAPATKGINLTIYHIGNFMRIYCKLTHDYNILGRHGFWKF